MSYVFALAILSGILTLTSGEDLRLVDLPPEEAQQHIESKDQTLKYAPKIDTNVPAVRVLGATPTNVLEDIYLANQYHGQDGIGGYLYGYSVPDIAKTEKKKAGGDLKGAYQYINGGGQEIKVQYWDDGSGFHQVDNLPEVLPQQVPDAPDVQAAKEEHFKRWHEEAERNSRPVSPYESGGVSQSSQQYQSAQYPASSQGGQPIAGQYQAGQGQYQPGQTQKQYPGSSQGGQYQSGQGQYQPGQSQGQGQYQSGQGQLTPGGFQAGQGGSQGQVGYQTGQGSYQASQSGSQIGQGGYPAGQGGYSPGQSGYQTGQSGYQGQSSQTGQDCCSGAGSQSGNEWEYKASEEEKGPPRGFFYNVDYPVGIIVQKQGAPGGIHKRESLESLYTQNRANYNQQLKNGASPDGSSHSSYQVHS